MSLSAVTGYLFSGSRSNAQANGATSAQGPRWRGGELSRTRVNDIDPMSSVDVEQHLIGVINRSLDPSGPPITLDSLDKSGMRSVVDDLKDLLQLGWMVEAVGKAIPKGASRLEVQAILQRMDCPDGVPEEMWEDYVGNPDGQYRTLVELYLAALPAAA
ncbi:hypothetical protein NMY22_g11909 [Coprinellus aureogranulatus]|nr:hypothetical protein NMY22_g11909 [Coprinellus aureogranulatus]